MPSLITTWFQERLLTFEPCDCTKTSRANCMFSPTCSTFSRQCPLSPDNVHYFQTTSIISRQRPLFPYMLHFLPKKRYHIYRHVPNAFTFATLQNVSFPLLGTPSRHPLLGAPPRQPSGPPADPAGQPARPKIRMVHYFLTKRFIISRHSILFPDKKIHYFPT
jgi:hypothetical protein